MADGRADNHPEEIGQAGGTAGIHGMTLCKTEKFSDGFPAEKNASPHPCTTSLRTGKGDVADAGALFPFWKESQGQRCTGAISAVLTIGIMTDIRQRRVRKNPVSMV